MLNAYQRTPVTGDQKVDSYGLFADGEWQFAPTLSVVGGVRYTRDTRRVAGCTADSGAALAAMSLFSAAPATTPLQG